MTNQVRNDVGNARKVLTSNKVPVDFRAYNDKRANGRRLKFFITGNDSEVDYSEVRDEMVAIFGARIVEASHKHVRTWRGYFSIYVIYLNS